MAALLNLVRVTLSTLGTGTTLQIAAAVPGWLDFNTAGGATGTVYRYSIIDLAGTGATEIGTATWNSAGNTLTGRTVLKSSNGNAPISLTAQAILAVSPAAEDLVPGGVGGNFGTLAAQNANNVAITGGSITGLSALNLASALDFSPQLSITNTDGAGAAPASAGYLLFQKNRTGAQVLNGDAIGTVFWQPFLNSVPPSATPGYLNAASISATVNGTVTATHAPIDMTFTVDDGVNANVTRMILQGAGTQVRTFANNYRFDNAANTAILLDYNVSLAGTWRAKAPLGVQADSAATPPGQLTIFGATNSNKQLVLGYHTTSDYGAIQAQLVGTGPKPLILQPGDGNVGIGAAALTGMPTPLGATLSFGNHALAAIPSTVNVLAIFDSVGTNLYGFGISSGMLNMIAGPAGALGFWQGTAPTMFIANNGNVGIGLAMNQSAGPPSRLTVSTNFAAQIVAGISGTTLTISSVSSGTVSIGQFIYGIGVSGSTQITGGSGLSWTITPSQTVAGGTTMQLASTPQAPTAAAQIQAQAADGQTTRIYMTSIGATNAFVGQRGNGTSAVPTAIALNDSLALFTATGYGGGAYSTAGHGGLAILAAEAWTATAQGAHTGLYSNPYGTSALTERMRVWSSGGANLGGSFVDPGTWNLAIGGTYISSVIVNAATFTGTITGGTTLTVSAVTGTIGIGTRLWFSGGQSTARVIANPSAGVFTIAPAQSNVGPVPMMTANLLHDFVFNGSGTTTGNSFAASQWFYVDNMTSGAQFIDHFAIVSNTYGGNGGRQLAQFNMQLTGWQATGGNQFACTLISEAIVSANCGGTGSGAEAGAIFALNPFVNITAAGTWLAEACASEVDVLVATPTTPTNVSPKFIFGEVIAQLTGHTALATGSSAALAFYNQTGAKGWPCLFLVGANAGAGNQNPFIDTTPGGTGQPLPNSSIMAMMATTAAVNGIDLRNGVFTGLPFASPGFSVDATAQVLATGAGHVFGQASNLQTAMGVNGAASGSNGGARVFIYNNSLVMGSIGNYSAVIGGAYNKDFTVGCDPTNGGNLWLKSSPSNWIYPISGSVSATALSTNYTQGLALGWNQSGGTGETNFVNKNFGAWDFVFHDWNGTTLSNLMLISNQGGIYNPAFGYFPAPFNATTFVGGVQGAIGGTIGNGSTAPTADTWCSMAFTCNSSDVHQVPYNSAGVNLGAALNCGVYIGYSGATSGSPLVGAATQAANIVMGKNNAFTAAGTPVYGQCGGLWINAWGGWNGTSFTFDKTGITLASGVKTYTVGAAPTSHAYYIGMPVTTPTGPGVLPANTVVVAFTSTTVTLNNAPTTIGSATLRFSAGVVGVSPADTYLWVGESHCHDVAGAGCGSEIFEAVSGVAVGANPFSTTWGVRVLCGIANNQNVGTNPPTHLVGFDVHAEYINGATSGSFTSGIAYNASGSNVSGATTNWGLFGATSVGGTISMNVSVSDPKVKRDVRRLPNVMALVNAIDPVMFRWADDYPGNHPGAKGNLHFGFLSYSGHGFRGVRDTLDGLGFPNTAVCTDFGTKFHGNIVSVENRQMTAILWRGVQEIWGEVGDVIDRMNGIEARVTALEAGRLN